MLRTIFTFALLSFIYCTAVFLQLDTFANDPGVGWHLETGRLAIGKFWPPTVDPYLHFPIARPWISDQWVSDIVLYKLYTFGGWPILYGVGVSLFLLVFGFILPWLCFQLGIGPVASLLTCAIAMKLSTIHLILRPVLFSFLFFSILFFQLVLAERNILDISKSKKSLFGILLLFVLWANMHPSFVLGFALIALTVVAHLLEKFLLKKELASEQMHFKLMLLGGCFVATLLNPYGYKLHESIFTLGDSSYFMNLHEEWKPLSSREGAGQLFIQVVCLTFVLLFLFKDKLQKLTTFEVMCYAAFLYAGFGSARFVPYFALCLGPCLGTLLTVKRKDDKSLGGIFIGVAASLCVFLYVCFTGTIPGFNDPFGPSRAKFPYEALEYLMKEEPNNEIPLFSHPNWGGFITWQSHGRVKPLLDDRNTLSGVERYKLIVPALSDLTKAIEISKSEGVKYILLPRTERLFEQATNRREIKAVFADSAAVLYKIH